MQDNKAFIKLIKLLRERSNTTREKPIKFPRHKLVEFPRGKAVEFSREKPIKWFCDHCDRPLKKAWNECPGCGAPTGNKDATPANNC